MTHSNISYTAARYDSVYSDVRLGEARVLQLEKALETCHSELQGHVNKIEADGRHHEEIVKAYKHQVIQFIYELIKRHIIYYVD